DIQLLWRMIARLRARGDSAQVRVLLGRIEAVDKSPHRNGAAEAAFARLQDDFRERVNQTLQPLLQDYIRKYPAHGGRAAALLSAAGATHAQVEQAFDRVFAAIDSPAEPDVSNPLNALVYDALSASAFDVALKAGEKQARLFPNSANAYDSLAEVYNYRGD